MFLGSLYYIANNMEPHEQSDEGSYCLLPWKNLVWIAPAIFEAGVQSRQHFQDKNRKITILWSFSYYSFVKFHGKKLGTTTWPCYILIHVIIRSVINGQHFLAHQIRISEILSWDRKSYLTHVILTRLSREGYTLVVLELTRHTCQVMSLFC